jgi:hypothetical protein
LFFSFFQKNAGYEKNLIEMVRRKIAVQVTSDFNAGTEQETRISKRMSAQNTMAMFCFMME